MFFEPPILFEPTETFFPQSSYQISSNSARNLPTITLQVSPERVPEKDDHRIIFNFTRTGDLNKPLIVYYSVKGTAEYNKDYKASFNNSEIQQIFFPSGVSSVGVEIIPIEDIDIENDETVILSIVPDDSYNRGTFDDVTGVIGGDKAAFAMLNYANTVPILAFATPLAFYPWGNNSSDSTISDNSTIDETNVKVQEPNSTNSFCTENCYEVPGPFSFLGLIAGFKATRKIRSRIKKND